VRAPRRSEVVADVQALTRQRVVGHALGGYLRRGRRRQGRLLGRRRLAPWRPTGLGLGEGSTVGDVADGRGHHEQDRQDRHASWPPALGELVGAVDGVCRARNQAGQQRGPRHDERSALTVHQTRALPQARPTWRPYPGPPSASARAVTDDHTTVALRSPYASSQRLPSRSTGDPRRTLR
jgi:hypothetical protein